MFAGLMHTSSELPPTDDDLQGAYGMHEGARPWCTSGSGGGCELAVNALISATGCVPEQGKASEYPGKGACSSTLDKEPISLDCRDRMRQPSCQVSRVERLPGDLMYTWRLCLHILDVHVWFGRSGTVMNRVRPGLWNVPMCARACESAARRMLPACSS